MPDPATPRPFTASANPCTNAGGRVLGEPAEERVDELPAAGRDALEHASAPPLEQLLRLALERPREQLERAIARPPLARRVAHDRRRIQPRPQRQLAIGDALLEHQPTQLDAETTPRRPRHRRRLPSRSASPDPPTRAETPRPDRRGAAPRTTRTSPATPSRRSAPAPAARRAD